MLCCNSGEYKTNTKFNEACTTSVSGTILEESESIILKSHNHPYDVPENSYSYWNILAPEGYVVSIIFHELNTESEWENHTYFCFGDNEIVLSRSLDFCSPWTCLTHENSQLKSSIFGKFVSKSSSLKIVFSSLMPRSGFSFRAGAIKIHGNHIIRTFIVFHYC